MNKAQQNIITKLEFKLSWLNVTKPINPKNTTINILDNLSRATNLRTCALFMFCTKNARPNSPNLPGVMKPSGIPAIKDLYAWDTVVFTLAKFKINFHLRV